MPVRKDGKLVVSVGSSRSGKSAFVKQQIKAKRRVIVWDIKGEYTKKEGFTSVYTKKALFDLVMGKHKTTNLKVCYVSNNLSHFEYWSKIAYLWGRLKPCVVVAEELADVTSPAKAPAAWGMLIRKILCFGCDVYAITQRPAESDKTIMGNNTVIHCGRLARNQDRIYMSKEMDIPVKTLTDLKPLFWVEKWSDGKVKQGKINF